jgi:hypothetical protein
MKHSTKSAEPDVQFLERGATLFKPAGTDVSIGFSWYKQGPLHTSTWRVDGGHNDGVLRAEAPQLIDGGYRSCVRLVGGAERKQYVLTNRATFGDPAEREDQAIVVAIL